MKIEILQKKKVNIDNEIIVKVDVRIDKMLTHIKIDTKKIREWKNIMLKSEQTISIKTDASEMIKIKIRAHNLRVMKKKFIKFIEESIESEYESSQDIKDWSTIVSAKIDIIMIERVRFTHIIRKKDIQFFMITLYKLNKLIDEKWKERQIKNEQRT